MEVSVDHSVSSVTSGSTLTKQWVGGYRWTSENGTATLETQPYLKTYSCYYYTPANKVWGVYRNRPVCLSVREFTSCLGHDFVPPCRIWIIFHTIVVHDPRVCHDLDPRTYLQGEDDSAHILKICVWAVTSHCQVWSGLYFTQLLSMTQGCVMTFTQGNISKAKVTVHTYPKSFSRP